MSDERWRKAATTVGLTSLALIGAWLAFPSLQQSTQEIPAPSAAVQQTPAPPPVAVDTTRWLTLEKMVSPRRLPTRPNDCTQPPPGGAFQVSIIEASRRRHCTDALEIWTRGMEDSEDHCTLMRTVWLCFNETETVQLSGRSFADFDELVPLLIHLEGDLALRSARADLPVEASAPSWSRPASGGIERRLEAFQQQENLQEVVFDLFGRPTVADDLAKDLWIEAQIARAIAKIPEAERTSYMIEVWARRVYVLASAMYGKPGELLQTNRKELYDPLRDLLAEAMQGAPELVREAYAVARREEPAQ